MKWYGWIGLGLVLIGGVVAVVWYVSDIRPEQQAREVSQPGTADQTPIRMPTYGYDEGDQQTAVIDQDTGVVWEFDGSVWQAQGTPPSCPDPLVLGPPVDLDRVTAILYPGQLRAGDYKPHGGFRFADGTNTLISVTAPLAAPLARASRYIEQGETQYLLEFVHACGFAYRFDHLLTLSPKFQGVLDRLPPAQADDSRTSRVDPPLPTSAGELIGTAVGFAKTGNTALDLGVYDFRTKNSVSQEAGWLAAHADDAELAPYAVCWFDLLSAADEGRVRSLPAGDTTSGPTSDYCK